MGRLRFLGSALVLVLAGCLERWADPTRVLDENSTGGPSTTTSAGTGGELFDDAVGQQPACCVKDKTDPFEGLSWFKIVTDPGALGSCPTPTTEGVTAYAEMKPIEPHTCGACSCSPAACTLPEGIHTNAAACPGDGSIAVPLGPDPAAGWEGACSEEGALPAGLQCGGEPCAQSVSIPTVPLASCKPESAPAAPFPDPTWGRMALQCKIEPLSGEGCEPEHVCAPGPPPEGFALCLYLKGEHPACPADYPDHMVFYTGVQDNRGCEACECSAPEGGECMALVSVFSDSACGALAGAVVVTNQDASCFDVVPGMALASMEASMVTDVPGSCAHSGGAPFGGVVPAEPLTLCCQGQPEPPG